MLKNFMKRFPPLNLLLNHLWWRTEGSTGHLPPRPCLLNWPCTTNRVMHADADYNGNHRRYANDTDYADADLGAGGQTAISFFGDLGVRDCDGLRRLLQGDVEGVVTDGCKVSADGGAIQLRYLDTLADAASGECLLQFYGIHCCYDFGRTRRQRDAVAQQGHGQNRGYGTDNVQGTQTVDVEWKDTMTCGSHGGFAPACYRTWISATGLCRRWNERLQCKAIDGVEARVVQCGGGEAGGRG